MPSSVSSARTARRATPAPGHRRPGRRRAGAIRWNRLARVALVIVLFAVVASYVGPLSSAWSTWRQSGAVHAQLGRLEHEHARLVARRRALHNPATLRRMAREMGMVAPDERPYVIRGTGMSSPRHSSP